MKIAEELHPDNELDRMLCNSVLFNFRFRSSWHALKDYAIVFRMEYAIFL
ncbi:MAG: hypothetical protein MK105_07335 [Crocinitomicaceae bacterium]|nr:hypothetical protein [Crocinitomicaceae bacterium]